MLTIKSLLERGYKKTPGEARVSFRLGLLINNTINTCVRCLKPTSFLSRWHHLCRIYWLRSWPQQ